MGASTSAGFEHRLTFIVLVLTLLALEEMKLYIGQLAL